ncbi:MAG TPA: hypothetical protein VN684_07185, partial [Terriglobales bacterium]|nr:hypothetical protein [Terriglobales bacterium]
MNKPWAILAAKSLAVCAVCLFQLPSLAQGSGIHAKGFMQYECGAPIAGTMQAIHLTYPKQSIVLKYFAAR